MSDTAGATDHECRLSGCTTLVGPGWDYCNGHRGKYGGRSASGTERKRISVLESMEITAEAEEEYDVCPECGEEYIGLDTTLTGTLVFIHQENPLKDCTLDTGTDQEADAR